MSKTLSALTSATTPLAGTEELYVVQGGNSRMTTAAAFYIPGGTDVAVADGGTGASTAAGARTNLGLVIGTDVQAYDADLAAWAGVNPSSYSTTAAIAAAYQPLDSDLTAIAALTTTTFGRSLLTKTAAEDVRTSLSTGPYVADRTAAKALNPTKDQAFTIIGEGGRNGAFIYVLTSSLSAADAAGAASDTLEGIYFTNGLYTAIRQGGWAVAGADARWWGYLADYDLATNVGTDNAATLNAAFAVSTVQHVRLPDGYARISDKVTVPTRKTLSGISLYKSMLVVDNLYNTFNMSATACVRLSASGQTGARMHDVGIKLMQDQTVSVRASVQQYPMALDMSGSPAGFIDNVHIEGAWDGIDAQGNAGNSVLGRFWVGALHVGLFIDGAQDFLHLGTYHFWPYSFSGNLYNNVFLDGTTYAAKIARADNLDCGSITSYQGIVQFASAGHVAGGASSISRHISRLALDGSNARLRLLGDSTQIGVMYTNYNTGATLNQIEVLGGATTIGSLMSDGEFPTNVPAVIAVTAGKLAVLGGRADIQDGSSRYATVVSAAAAAELTLADMKFDILLTNRTVSLIQQSGAAAVIKLKGLEFPTSAGLTGNIITVGNDNAGNMLVGNDFGGSAASGWVVALPASPNIGLYGPNKDVRRLFTTTLTATTGTITTVNGATALNYTILGDMCEVEGFYSITTNGTGATALQMTLPFTANGQAYGTGRQTAGGTTMLLATVGSLTNTVNLVKSDGTYPGGDGFAGRFSVTFRIR